MSTTKTIKSALISVFSKEGLEPIVRKLHEQNVTFYSTGGTEDFIKNLGIPVVAVEDVTSYPSILGGRVKTLHPLVFGGNNKLFEENAVEIFSTYCPKMVTDIQSKNFIFGNKILKIFDYYLQNCN